MKYRIVKDGALLHIETSTDGEHWNHKMGSYSRTEEEARLKLDEIKLRDSLPVEVIYEEEV